MNHNADICFPVALGPSKRDIQIPEGAERHGLRTTAALPLLGLSVQGTFLILGKQYVKFCAVWVTNLQGFCFCFRRFHSPLYLRRPKRCLTYNWYQLFIKIKP